MSIEKNDRNIITHTHTHTHIHTHTKHTHTLIHSHTHTHTHTYIYTHTHTHTYIYIHTHTTYMCFSFFTDVLQFIFWHVEIQWCWVWQWIIPYDIRFIGTIKSKVGDRSRGRPERSLFNSCYTEVFSLDCSTLTFETYLIMLSAKQGGIKYPFLSLWYDLIWD